MVSKRKKAMRRWWERRSQGRSTPLFEGSSNTQEVLPLFGEEKYRSERGGYDRLEKQWQQREKITESKRYH
jgi:hypothetical protein